MNNFLYKELNINPNKKEIISLVGGGGKTTAIFKLAKELKTLKKKVLITTTTNILLPEKNDYDNFYLKDIKEDEFIPPSSISILGQKIINPKLKGLDKSDLEKLIDKNLFDFYLIEADGAKGKPIKAPNPYEPVIIDSTSKTLGLIGLDALGKEIWKISHRPEILMALLNKKPYDLIETGDIINLILDKNGLFKDSKGESILLLNKASNEGRVARGKIIKNDLSKYSFKNTIIGDLLTSKFY